MTVKKWGIGILLLLVFISTVVAVTTVTLEMAEYTNSSAPSMSITATEPGINPKMSFSCNGTDFSGEIGFVSPYEEFDITNPTFGCTSDEGSKTVYAKVTDDETPEGVTESDTIIYDITAPTTDYAIDPTDPNGADDWYIETAPTITLTCTDALSGCQINYEWNSEGEQTVASPLVLTAIEGDNTFSYYATDGAGNDETLQGPVTLNVDSFADFTALTINDGDTHTNNTTDVDLALDGTVGDFTGTPCLITVDGTPDQNVAFQTTITNYPWTPGDDNEKTIMVACTDIHGNVQEQFDTIILDTAPPDINSFELKGGADYANAEDETTITINVEGSADLAECHFGMEETSLGEYLAYSSSGMDFAWDTNSGNGEYTVYGECRDSVGYVSTPVQSDSITLDVTAPEVPVLSGAPFGPTGIKLNWSEVVDNGPSGLLEFDVVGYATGLGTGTREYLVEDLASGTSYTFRLIARDNAGNESLSDEVTVTTNPVDNQPANNPPANNPSANVPAAIPNGPNWLNPIEGATVSGTTTLQVEITSSASTASKVAFYLDGYATTDQIEQVNKGSSSIIELEWDSTTVEDGEHDLYAKTYYVSGMSASVSQRAKIKVTVNNTTPLPEANSDTTPEEESANQALEEALEEQQKAKEKRDLAQQFLENNSELDSKYTEGSRLLREAQSALNNENFEESQTKSETATALFKEIQDSATFVQDEDYLYSEENAFLSRDLMGKSQLNPVFFGLSEGLADSISAERHIIIFKQEDSQGNQSFFVQVVLKIKNISEETDDFVLIEFVPKIVSDTSELLSSPIGFIVLETDPLLQWNITGLQANEERELGYGVQKAFSEEEIQALLASPDLAPFKTAPLVVKADSLEENSALLVPAAPLGFAFLTDLLATPIIIGIVVILVILALAWQNGKREKPYLHLGNVHNSLKGRVSNLKEKSVQARSRRREDPFEKAMEEFSGQEETLESAMKKFKEAKPETPKTLSTTESTMGKTILAPVTQKQKEIQEKTTEKKEPIAHEGTWKTKLTGLFGSNPNKMLLQSRRPDCATVLLREAGHPSLCLKLKNGVTVKGLCDLDAVLQEMDDTTFVFHKNPSRDDFSAWVRRSVGDNVLANKLELLDSKQDIARAVHLRVDWLKHQINE